MQMSWPSIDKTFMIDSRPYIRACTDTANVVGIADETRERTSVYAFRTPRRSSSSRSAKVNKRKSIYKAERASGRAHFHSFVRIVHHCLLLNIASERANARPGQSDSALPTNSSLFPHPPNKIHQTRLVCENSFSPLSDFKVVYLQIYLCTRERFKNCV